MGRKHPNELKLKKQQRMRRAYLKPYSASQVHVPQQIDKSKVPASAEGIFDYRQRGKGFFDPYWDAIFPGVMKRFEHRLLDSKQSNSEWRSTPTEAKATVKSSGLPYPNQGEDNKLNGKKYAMTRAEEERIVDMLADEADSFLTIRQGGITKTRLTWMFNRKKTRNFFVETCLHPSGGYIRKSMVYCAEERAMFAFKNNRIEWDSIVPLTVDPEPPSG